MEKFLKDIFGIDAVCQKFSDFASLSRLLVEAYDYVLVEINEVKFLAIAPVYEQPTIPTLVNHMKKISSEKNLPVVQGVFLISFGNGVQLQQSRLPHEDSLYLEEVIPVMIHRPQRQFQRPLLKGIAIDSETIVSG